MNNEKIICLGWGSLVWCPKELNIDSEWFTDGPSLPIEFTRLSEGGRMTLVIDNHQDTHVVSVLWTTMKTSSLEEAKESLRKREKTTLKNIHSVSIVDAVSGDQIKSEIKSWLIKKGFVIAIWTGFSWSSKGNKIYFGNQRPNKEQVVEYLSNLKNTELASAKEYIEKAPKQISTNYRADIEKVLGI